MKATAAAAASPHDAGCSDNASHGTTCPDAQDVLSQCPACTAPVFRAYSEPIPLCAECAQCGRCGAIGCQADHDAEDFEDARAYEREHM